MNLLLTVLLAVSMTGPALAQAVPLSPDADVSDDQTGQMPTSPAHPQNDDMTSPSFGRERVGTPGYTGQAVVPGDHSTIEEDAPASQVQRTRPLR